MDIEHNYSDLGEENVDRSSESGFSNSDDEIDPLTYVETIYSEGEEEEIGTDGFTDLLALPWLRNRVTKTGTQEARIIIICSIVVFIN